ncbi:MAG: hypothetical protein KBT19_08365 [Lachnospiraceae bacterium]|nr:hypothetical protein [Candidatus Colinaster equi]
MKKSNWFELRKIIEILVIACILVISYWATGGIKKSADTDVYLQFLDWVPPVYPVFIRIISFIAPQHYEILAFVLQAMLAIYATVYATDVFCRHYGIDRFRVLVMLCVLVTYFKADEHGTSASAWLMTEGLAYSMFIILAANMVSYYFTLNRAYFIRILIDVTLLTLCRSQFAELYIIIAIYLVIIALVKEYSIKRNALIVVGIIASALIWMVGQKIYEQNAVPDRVHSYGKSQVTSHLLYYMEDGDLEEIADAKVKVHMMDIYTDMKQAGMSYADRPDDWLGTAEHYKEAANYNRMMMMKKNKAYFGDEYTDLAESELLDVEKSVLAKYYVKWIGVSLLQLPISVSRSISLYYPPLGILFLIANTILLVVYLGLNILEIRKKGSIQPENVMCMLILMLVVGNAIGTGFLIRSITRYLAYPFGIFYVSFLIVLVKYVEEIKRAN